MRVWGRLLASAAGRQPMQPDDLPDKKSAAISAALSKSSSVQPVIILTFMGTTTSDRRR